MEKTNVRHVRAAARTHIYHRHYKTGYISSVGQVKKKIIIIMAVVSRPARVRNTSGYMENIIHNKTYRFTINIYIRFEKT